MKDSMVLMLDENALKRLMGDDPQFEIAIKQAVLNDIAKNCCKQVALAEVKEYLRNAENYNNEIKKQFNEQLLDNGNRYQDAKHAALTPKIVEQIKYRVKSAFDTELKNLIDKYEVEFDEQLRQSFDKFNADLKVKLEDNDKRMKEHLDKHLSWEGAETCIKAMLKDVLAEKFKTLFEK